MLPIAETKVSKPLVFLIGVRGSSFFIYIFFFNDTLFAPLNFYSDFYSVITGLIWCMGSLNCRHHTDGQKDLIMAHHRQLNKHARIQEVLSEGFNFDVFFFVFLFLV